MTLRAGYFDELYARSTDPWGFRDRWYELRKRELTMAALPQPRYARGFEAGCSIGLLTSALAGRCDELFAVDASEGAVRQAAREVAAHEHVHVQQRMLPGDWPADERFDLVVLSEVGYYFDEPDLALLLTLAVGALLPGGSLLACHWRHPVVDYPLPGDVVHRAIERQAELVRTVRHDETDFLLEVYTRGKQPSVAQREGLAP